MDMDNILIDGLEYVNWNRDLFIKAHAGGLTAIHATLVYWEDTKESLKKIDYWDNLIQSMPLDQYSENYPLCLK